MIVGDGKGEVDLGKFMVTVTQMRKFSVIMQEALPFLLFRTQ